MTQKLGASASTAPIGFGVVDWTTLGVAWTTLGVDWTTLGVDWTTLGVDWTTLGVDWTTLAVGLTAVAGGIEVELSTLHKSLAQQSDMQVKAMPELLYILQTIR